MEEHLVSDNGWKSPSSSPDAVTEAETTTAGASSPAPGSFQDVDDSLEWAGLRLLVVPFEEPFDEMPDFQDDVSFSRSDAGRPSLSCHDEASADSTASSGVTFALPLPIGSPARGLRFKSSSAGLAIPNSPIAALPIERLRLVGGVLTILLVPAAEAEAEEIEDDEELVEGDATSSLPSLGTIRGDFGCCAALGGRFLDTESAEVRLRFEPTLLKAPIRVICICAI
jgi:hypothetical protein